MITARFLVPSLAIPLLVACATTRAPGPQPQESDSRTVSELLVPEIVGWYETSPDHKVLLTWAPDSGELRLLDFDSVRFHRVEREPSGSLQWVVGGEAPPRTLAFLRDNAGTVTGLRWFDEEGSHGTMARAREYPFDQEAVRFRSSDSTLLAGLLMVPRVRKLVGRVGGTLRDVSVLLPAAVVIHGSGSSDRDNVWAFHIAQHLARNGVAVLLPDKRGSGASQGDWRTADFVQLAEDALAGVALVRAHEKVDRTRVGVVGLSQGGWIAPEAAVRDTSLAFVINVSGSGVSPAEQVRHEVIQDLQRAAIPAEQMDHVLGLLQLADEYSRRLSAEQWQTYASRRAELLDGPLADVVRAFPDSRDHWHWQWWHQIVDFNPLERWRALDQPVLVVFGADDEHDNVPVAESVRRLRTALTVERRRDRDIRVIAESGHALTAPGGWIRPEFLALLSGWIRSTIGEERDAAVSHDRR